MPIEKVRDAVGQDATGRAHPGIRWQRVQVTLEVIAVVGPHLADEN